MTNDNNTQDTHEQVFELLPWWVNNTLESRDRVLVDRHLADCQICQDEVQFINLMTETTASDAASCHTQPMMDVEGSLTSVLERIESAGSVTPPSVPAKSVTWRLSQVIKDFLAPGQSLSWAASAMAVCLVVFAGTYFWQSKPSDGNTYHVLSESAPADTAIRVRIEFISAADEQMVRGLVDEHGGVPEPVDIQQQSDKAYVIVLPDSVGVVELNEWVGVLKSHNEVSGVALIP